MPVVFRWKGLSLPLLLQMKATPREPVHIHVPSEGANAKFWLYPDAELAYQSRLQTPARSSACKRLSSERRDGVGGSVE